MTDQSVLPCLFVVADDDSIHHLVATIAGEMRVDCETFLTAEEFLAEYQPDRPGCVVSEFRLHGMNGIELQRELKEKDFNIPLCFVAKHPETHLVVRAMRLGAITVLEQPVSEQELWDSVREALARDAATRKIETRQAEIRRRFAKLNRRERSVLTMVINGVQNKRIAREMMISVRTVEACRQKIFSKTQTNSVAELVKLAVEINWDFNGTFFENEN